MDHSFNLQVSLFKLGIVLSLQVLFFLVLLFFLNFPISESVEIKIFILILISIFIFLGSFITKLFLEVNISKHGIQQKFLFLEFQVSWNDQIEIKKGRLFTFVLKERRKKVLVLPGPWLIENHKELYDFLGNYKQKSNSKLYTQLLEMIRTCHPL